MNVPTTIQNSQFPYGSTAYEDGPPFLNGFSRATNVDPNPMASASFSPYNYGFSGFSDPFGFSNFGYFNNQAAGQYPPSSTSISLATPLQTSSIYQQNVSQFAKQFKETRTEDVRTNPPRSNLDRLVVGSKTKTKRRRNLFSAEQVRIMETHFAESQQIQTTERNELAKIVGLSPQQVKIWFQNRRYKDKVARREYASSTIQRSRPIPEKTGSFIGHPPKDDQDKIDVKSEEQIMPTENGNSDAPPVDCFPQIYSNWQSTGQQASFFSLHPDVYTGGGFSNFQPSINYSQMLPDFHNLSIAYYNHPNGGGPANSS